MAPRFFMSNSRAIAERTSQVVYFIMFVEKGKREGAGKRSVFRIWNRELSKVGQGNRGGGNGVFHIVEKISPQ